MQYPTNRNQERYMAGQDRYITSNDRNTLQTRGVYGSMEELAAVRSKAILLVVIGALGLLCCFILPFAMVATRGSAAPLFMFLGMGLFIFFMYRYAALVKKYKLVYKQVFVDGTLRKNFGDVVYYWDKGFREADVRTFGLCRMGNRFYSEDYVRASYSGVPFESSDVKVQQHTSSGKSSSTVTYFKGRMMVMTFPEKMVMSVQVYSSGFIYRAKNPVGFKMEKVEMESAEFNKKFDVFSPSPHDAFYLLTPQFMERLERLLDRYKGIALRFSGNKVFFALKEPANDAFDPKSMMSKISYPEEMAKIQEDINDIKRIITLILDLPVGPVKNPQNRPQGMQSGMQQMNGLAPLMMAGLAHSMSQGMPQGAPQGGMPQGAQRGAPQGGWQQTPQGGWQQTPQGNWQQAPPGYSEEPTQRIPQGMDGPTAMDLLKQSRNQ